MSLPEQLHRLQQVDSELQRKQQELDEVEDRLRDDRALRTAESRLAAQNEQLADARKKQKSLEWELEDLQDKARQTDSKLYGGATRNPKELVNLEKEIKIVRGQIGRKEDALLGLMSQIEEMEAGVRAGGEESARLREEWERTQDTLVRRKGELERALGELGVDRDDLSKQIEPAALDLYQRIRRSRDLAVVKVERGRCQGCHITVPTSQWQKAKSGSIVQCSSCNRILSVE